MAVSEVRAIIYGEPVRLNGFLTFVQLIEQDINLIKLKDNFTRFKYHDPFPNDPRVNLIPISMSVLQFYNREIWWNAGTDKWWAELVKKAENFKLKHEIIIVQLGGANMRSYSSEGSLIWLSVGRPRTDIGISTADKEPLGII